MALDQTPELDPRHSPTLSGVALTQGGHPKVDGKQRPLGSAVLEDKIVQQAVVTALSKPPGIPSFPSLVAR